MSTAHAHHEATDDELREAYAVRRCLARSPWPATFEEAMADPMCAGLIRLHAERVALLPPARRVRTEDTPSPARSQRYAFRPLAPGFVDLKRAASGDRDD